MPDAPIDPVDLEILWSRLITITNEQAAALQRTSFTPIVRESGDLSAAVFDAGGRMLAQAVTGTPGHINSLATSMVHFLEEFPVDGLHPGDVLITNDPWKTSGQLNDLSVVTPVFKGDRVIGFFGNCCHAVDIGGRGLSADAAEVFEEGLWIPMTKLYSRGAPNSDLFRLIESNVRSPREVIGDLHAQVAGNRVGAESLIAYLDEFGMSDLVDLGGEIIRRSEAATRAAIERIPDGQYRRVIQTDGLEEPVRIECTVSVRDDEILVDYSGSSSQVDRGINVVLNYTTAYTTYALQCAISPGTPHNTGTFAPVHVTAPEGSILNARYPCAVAARHIVGHFLPHAVLGALSEVIPSRVIAEGSGNVWLTTVRGAGEERFVTVFFASGGTGARPSKDGMSTTSFPSGIATASIEVIEAGSPLMFVEKEFRGDSGGRGQYRGGLGQRIEVRVLTDEPYIVSSLADRMRYPAMGYRGGEPGALSGFYVGDERIENPKLSRRVEPGTSFTLELPGGGGYGEARLRDPDLVEQDIREGLVSEV